MTLKERNEKLLEFFHENGVRSARYIGNPVMPAIIAYGNMVLSCHVSNNTIYFTDLPKNGEVVWEVDLEGELHGYQEKLQEIIHNNIHRKCLRIQLVDGELLEMLRAQFGEDDLYLTDYHFNKVTRVKTPIFTPGPEVKLYFEQEQAEDAVRKILLTQENINIKIV